MASRGRIVEVPRQGRKTNIIIFIDEMRVFVDLS